jgi:5-methyltetrahydropteroyltriglutamate--homocysteine methyltransferase
MPTLPKFPVTVVGSWPRPAWLLEAQKKKKADLEAVRDDACLLAIKRQEDAGCDILTDGEQRRDNFYSFICERLDGTKLMSMAELLDFVEDKAGFETLLSALDVPAFAIKNPVVVGKLARRRPLALDDVQFTRKHTNRAIKATLPGPYLFSRSIWVKKLSEGAYPTREGLCDDIVRILREEIAELVKAGVEMIQLDEPVLSELVFAGKSATRTFMCAALAAKASPEEELELAVDLVNRVFAGFSGPIRAMHVCRGNWSTKEEVLLAGPYDDLMPYFARMDVDQFVLEYATPRAGPLEVLAKLPPRSSVGLGAVNPRTMEIEDPKGIAARARRTAEILGGRAVFLNPDCGFGTFADRPVASMETAEKKIAALAAAARILRA